MRVIPVIDLQDCFVVRGVAGERATYQPVVSSIAADARPATIAAAFVQRFGLHEIYVADLDALAGAEPNWEVYREIADVGARIIVDAGLSDVTAARRWSDFASRHSFVTGVIVALESCQSVSELADVWKTLPDEVAVFSLDLVQGRPKTKVPAWRNATVEDIVQTASGIGFRRLILLDLADVGAGRGPSSLQLCRSFRALYPNVELIAGGGVRNLEDLRSLAACGCDGALVASALHDGRLRAEDLRLFHLTGGPVPPES